MATISPFITTSSTPGLQATMVTPGLTYSGFVSGLGGYVYKIDEMFYGNALYAQLAQGINYTRHDNSGDSTQKVISTPVNPAQFQPTMYVPLKARNVIVDGQGTLDFLFLAANAIQFIFYAQYKNINNALNNVGGLDNFKTVERALGKPGFFEDPQEDKGVSMDLKFIDDEEGNLNFSPLPISAEPLIITTPKKQSFILNLVNNTGGNIPVSLFNQGNPGSIGLFNATTRYQWDITGISYATPNVSINVYPVGSAGAFSVLTGSLQQQNAQGLVDFLNTLGAGSFWLETSGPNTYIVTWNTNLVYGELSVGVATTTIAWSNTRSNSNMNVLANAVNIISSSAPPESGTVSVSNGANITGGGAFFPVQNYSFNITRTFKFPPFNTKVVQSASVIGGLIFIIAPFVINASYTYNITLTP